MGVGMVVLKGVVIYGFDSSIIDIWMCLYIYGIKLEKKFNFKIDNLFKIFMKGN